MGAILQQLGLDQSFFVLFAIFAVLYVLLSQLYFKPFLKLFESRHKRTVQDREAAETMLAQAQKKLEEYKRVLAEERLAARKEYDALLMETKKQEAELLSQARAEAKKITQEVVESITKQKKEVVLQLEKDVDSLAAQISEKLLSGTK